MKYTIDYSKKFKKQYLKLKHQGKDLKKLQYVIKKISNGEELDNRFHNHKLVDNKIYKDCYECHIEPDWLLIYKIFEDDLIILLYATGSHSNLFK